MSKMFIHIPVHSSSINHSPSSLQQLTFNIPTPIMSRVTRQKTAALATQLHVDEAQILAHDLAALTSASANAKEQHLSESAGARPPLGEIDSNSADGSSREEGGSSGEGGKTKKRSGKGKGKGAGKRTQGQEMSVPGMGAMANDADELNGQSILYIYDRSVDESSCSVGMGNGTAGQNGTSS